jgi:hypothetical protein
MWLLLIAVLVAPTQSDPSTELSELRARASTIHAQESAGEITREQMRRKVELLLKDFQAWTEAHDVSPEIRNRTHTVKQFDPAEPLTVDRCSPFFDENREKLCLLDLKRSELWGGTVLFCRYFCE